jgi:general secretion pathway protein K
MKRQKGVAVIMAILIVALAAMVASALMWEQSLWLRQVENENNRAEANAIAIAGTTLAAAILNNDARNIVDLQGVWSQPLPPMPVDSGEISGFIQDQQGFFNLNNLVNNGKIDQDQKAIFERLLGLLDIPAELGNSLADWISDDNETQDPGGTEDAYYLGLHPPYRAAHRMLTEVDDLSKVRGFNSNYIHRLTPFVTVLPRPTRININTAPPEVLYAIVEGITLPEARTLTAVRDQSPFSSIGNFRSALPRIALSVADSNVSIASHFFLVTVNAHFGRASTTVWTLLDREGNLWPNTVWQKSS